MHRLIHFEHASQPLASRATYYARLRRNVIVSAILIVLSLAIGTVGYHGFENLAWIDALLNAAMILGGMGPVATLTSTGSKLFAAAYALYSGFILLLTAGIVIAPVMHRLLHHFHVRE
jgi:hypothetical protein